MAEGFSVTQTEPWTYIDQGNKVVNGFRVTVHLTKYNEQHTLNVPTLDSAIVKAVIEKLLKDRDALARL